MLLLLMYIILCGIQVRLLTVLSKMLSVTNILKSSKGVAFGCEGLQPGDREERDKSWTSHLALDANVQVCSAQ